MKFFVAASILFSNLIKIVQTKKGKNMTPMQILKNNFLYLSKKLDQFEEINLNKSQAKDTLVQNIDDEYVLCFPEEQTNFSHFTKKGVKSDFIKIFKAKVKGEKYSIAFHFNYLNVDTPTIQCSVKQGENFLITDKMSIDNMREKINRLNNELNSQNVITITEKIKKEFFILSKNNKLKM